MSLELQRKVSAFLVRPAPAGTWYVLKSISEHFLDEYAEDGELYLGGGFARAFEEAVQDAINFSRNKTGEEGAYFKERAGLLIEIQSEFQEDS